MDVTGFVGGEEHREVGDAVDPPQRLSGMDSVKTWSNSLSSNNSRVSEVLA